MLAVLRPLVALCTICCVQAFYTDEEKKASGPCQYEMQKFGITCKAKGAADDALCVACMEHNLFKEKTDSATVRKDGSSLHATALHSPKSCPLGKLFELCGLRQIMQIQVRAYTITCCFC
jgi:hypothetical protein